MATRRKLFWSDLGPQRLIDLAPALAQKHDCICILQGARVPFIVRRTECRERFRLIGEALVENFVHGELERFNFSRQEILLV